MTYLQNHIAYDWLISQPSHINAIWKRSPLSVGSDFSMNPSFHATSSLSTRGSKNVFVRGSFDIFVIIPTSTTFSLRNLKWWGKFNSTRYVRPVQKLIRCLTGWNQYTFNMAPWFDFYRNYNLPSWYLKVFQIFPSYTSITDLAQHFYLSNFHNPAPTLNVPEEFEFIL